MLQIKQVSQKRKIINFVECSQRPFTSRKISDELNIPISTVMHVLKQLHERKLVKKVSRQAGNNIYARKTNFLGKLKSRTEEKHQRIRATYEACTLKTQKEIAEITGIPVTSLKVYLDILYASGSIIIVRRKGKTPYYYEKKQYKYNGLRHEAAKKIRGRKLKQGEGVRHDMQ
jgi:transcription initiation factor IIE alpha subunit